jgi:hypothetical protein
LTGSNQLCIEFVGDTLTTSSAISTVALDITFTSATTGALIVFNNYIYSNIHEYILIDKSLLISGYTLTTSSDKATVGLDFTFTCVTTDTAITFNRDSSTVCTITGGNTDGTCIFEGGYLTNYAYKCNPTTNTYTVTIPGSYLTDSLHGTSWRCQHPFGEGTVSNTKILYVNGK